MLKIKVWTYGANVEIDWAILLGDVDVVTTSS
jgi:hypothetical protein